MTTRTIMTKKRKKNWTLTTSRRRMIMRRSQLAASWRSLTTTTMTMEPITNKRTRKSRSTSAMERAPNTMRTRTTTSERTGMTRNLNLSASTT